MPPGKPSSEDQVLDIFFKLLELTGLATLHDIRNDRKVIRHRNIELAVHPLYAMLLQQAILPPPPWAAVCLRLLMHRDPSRPNHWLPSLHHTANRVSQISQTPITKKKRPCAQ